jgi:hypothetical protein
MVKIVAVLGLLIIGVFILQPQITSKLSCTYDMEADLGMQELNQRKADYLERQQAQQQQILDSLAPTEEAPAPTPEDPNAF